MSGAEAVASGDAGGAPGALLDGPPADLLQADGLQADGPPGSAPSSTEARSRAEESSAGTMDPEEGEAEPPTEPEPGPGPGRALSDEELVRGVCALVFASPDPLSTGRLVSLLEGPEPARVRAALAELGRRLDASLLPLELRELAGGWRILTRSEAAPLVARLAGEERVERISAAALETLAIVAYRQPVTKAEIEAIRGVQAGPILRSLIDRGLVRVAGRSDQPGHPLQYGTTRAFLDRFGLARLEDLPRDGELAED